MDSMKDPVFVKKHKKKCLIYALEKGGNYMDIVNAINNFVSVYDINGIFNWAERTSFQDLIVYGFATFGAIIFSKKVLRVILR
jgi:hypothetical protein